MLKGVRWLPVATVALVIVTAASAVAAIFDPAWAAIAVGFGMGAIALAILTGKE
jgi:hypothetical protein